MPLTIAVTGAGGTIGQGVTLAALKEGHSVVAIDKSPSGQELELHEDQKNRFEYRSADLTNYDAFKTALKGCNAIVHLAAVYNLSDPENPDGPLLREELHQDIHNMNTAMSWNALGLAAELGINRVAQASSVNAIGMIWSEPRPQFDYLPLDEEHPCYPQDAYSLCKLMPQFIVATAPADISIIEEQGKAFARRYPKMRIASIRPHWVIPEDLAYDKEKLHKAEGTWKDLWGWVSTGAISQAFLLALTAPESTFPPGHEVFFTVAPTMCQQGSSKKLLDETFPEITDLRREWKGNEGFFDCSKAERMLGWTERGFMWTP